MIMEEKQNNYDLATTDSGRINIKELKDVLTRIMRDCDKCGMHITNITIVRDYAERIGDLSITYNC